MSDYAETQGFEVLSSINVGEGFWVNVQSASAQQLPPGAHTPVVAFRTNGSISLGKGWSLISTSESMTPVKLIETLDCQIDSIWAWDNASGKWYFCAPSLAAQGGTVLTDYINTHGYLDFAGAGKSFGAGVGFWVNKP